MTARFPGRVVLAAIQVGWLALAVVNVLAGLFGWVVTVLEVILLAVLLWRSHVRVTRVLDPGPAGADATGGDPAPDADGSATDASPNVFADDPVIRLSATGSALAYVAVLVLSGLFAPSGRPSPASAPTTVLGGSLAVFGLSAATVGWYLHWQYPGVGGGFERVGRHLLSVAPPTAREREVTQLREALRGDRSPAARTTILAVSGLAIGAVVALIAFVFGALGALLLNDRLLLVLVVVGWLLYDAFVRNEPGDRGLGLVDLGERVGRPERVLFGLELERGWFRGLFTGAYHVGGGITVTVMLGRLALVTAVSGPRVPADPGVSAGPLPAWLVAIMAWVSAVAASLLLAAYSFLVWYALMRRMPKWVGGTMEGTARVVALPGPTDCAYPLALVAYFWLTTWTTAGGPGQVGARRTGFVVLAAVFAALLVTGARTTRRLRLPVAGVARDNYRVLVFAILAFGVPWLAGHPRSWPAMSTFLAGAAMVYFIPEVVARAERTGWALGSALFVDGYLVVAGVAVAVSGGRLVPALSPAVPVVGALGVALVAGTLLDHWLL